MTKAESAVRPWLLHGAARAVTVRELAAITKLHPRTVKGAIRGLRVRHSIPIAARRGKNPGLFLPQTPREIEDCIRTLMRDAIQSIRTARTLRNSPELETMLGQLELWAR